MSINHINQNNKEVVLVAIELKTLFKCKYSVLVRIQKHEWIETKIDVALMEEI